MKQVGIYRKGIEPFPDEATIYHIRKAEITSDSKTLPLHPDRMKSHKPVRMFLLNGSLISPAELVITPEVHRENMLCVQCLHAVVHAEAIGIFLPGIQRGELPTAYAYAKRRGLRAAYADTGQTLARCPVSPGLLL